MKLSIVSTLYCTEPHLDEFYSRCTEVAQRFAGHDYEIILVNDGSPDSSLDVALRLHQDDAHVVVLDLSRNYGHHKAMMTGLSYSKGDKVLLIDSDLEESPEWLMVFDNLMKKNHADVVFGVQDSRKGNWFERVSGEVFYTALDLMTGLKLARNITTSRLMTREYVDALVLHLDREVFIAGLWHITGFKQIPHSVKKGSNSKTTYSLRHKISILVNSVTSFSTVPLKFIFNFGLFISAVSIVSFIYLLANKFFFSQPLSGWTSIMASVWLLGGLMISFIGVLGIYLAKIFSETKERPYTIIRRAYERK